jgi:DNA-binding NarL/FixJ family response regulator
MLRTVALRCLIVDDNPDFLAAARRLLTRDRIEVVGVALQAAEALRLADALQPDVVLVDVYLGAEDGFELAHRFAERTAAGRPAVVMISTYGEKDLVDLLAASPAVGFVPKSELSGAAIHAALGSTPPG